MNLSLKNTFRTTAKDDWVQLAPFGRWPHTAFRESGEPMKVIQVVDSGTMQALIANSSTKGMQLVDYDHLSDDQTQSTEAAGWIDGLTLRHDGLYGHIRWTDTGRAAIENGRYRFISPVWNYAVGDEAGDGSVEVYPTQLIEAGLTNKPNIAVRPLFNSRKETPLMMKKIAQRLGLPEDATEEQILAALPEMKNGDYEKMKNRAETAESELQKLRNAQVEDDLASYADVIGPKPEPREFFREALLQNRARALGILDQMVAKQKEGQPLSNRQAPRNPDSTPGQRASASADIEREVKAYQLANRCSYSDAWNQVRAAKPELFTQA